MVPQDFPYPGHYLVRFLDPAVDVVRIVVRFIKATAKVVEFVHPLDYFAVYGDSLLRVCLRTIFGPVRLPGLAFS